MKIISWNINGIRAFDKKFDINWFLENDIDIICFQEIKADIENIPQKYIGNKDYHPIFLPANKKGYAGTGILTKNKPINITKKLGIPKFDNEGRFLFLEYEKFYIINSYFPNSQHGLLRLDFKIEYNNAFLKFINELKDKPVIFTGDLNVAHMEMDLKNPDANKKNPGFTIEEREYIDTLIQNEYIDVFRYLYPDKIQYTWWSYRFNARKRNIGWRIDYFFIHKKYVDKIKDCIILDQIQGSDHCPILLDIDL